MQQITNKMFMQHRQRVSVHTIYAIAFIVIIHKICIGARNGIKIKAKWDKSISCVQTRGKKIIISTHNFRKQQQNKNHS